MASLILVVLLVVAIAPSEAQHDQACVEAVDGSATCASKGATMMQLSALDLSAAEAEFKIQEKQLLEGTEGTVNEQEEHVENNLDVEQPKSRSIVHPHAAVGAAMMQLSALDLSAAEAELKIQEKQLLEGTQSTVTEHDHLENDVKAEEPTSRSTLHRHAAVGATMMQLSALDLNAAEAELKIQEKQLLKGSEGAVNEQEEHEGQDANGEEAASRLTVQEHAAVGTAMMQLSALDLNAAEAELKIHEKQLLEGTQRTVTEHDYVETDVDAEEAASSSTVHRHAAVGAAMMQLSALDLNAAEAELKIQEKHLLDGTNGAVTDQEEYREKDADAEGDTSRTTVKRHM